MPHGPGHDREILPAANDFCVRPISLRWRRSIASASPVSFGRPQCGQGISFDREMQRVRVGAGTFTSVKMPPFEQRLTRSPRVNRHVVTTAGARRSGCPDTSRWKQHGAAFFAFRPQIGPGVSRREKIEINPGTDLVVDPVMVNLASSFPLPDKLPRCKLPINAGIPTARQAADHHQREIEPATKRARLVCFIPKGVQIQRDHRSSGHRGESRWPRHLLQKCTAMGGPQRPARAVRSAISNTQNTGHSAITSAIFRRLIRQ